MPMLNKYSNYDAMNAAFLASLPSFYGMGPIDPRTAALTPYNFHRLLEMTSNNAQHSIDMLRSGSKNGDRHNNKTPSLHSDPEDMIEEVTDDMGEDVDAEISDETSKLVMDIDEDEQTEAERSRQISPMLSESTYLNIPPIASITEREKSSNPTENMSPRSVLSHSVEIKEERSPTPKSEDLACSRCNQKFNHPTELVQHEKVLCGMFRNHEAIADSIAMQQAFNMHSGSDDENDEMQKGTSDAERKVRVRTAISEEQQIRLKEHYALNARPNREEFRSIAQRLSLDARVVQVWFQNNRSRERKMNSLGYLKTSTFDTAYQSVLSNSVAARSRSPVVPFVVESQTDEPLDLSVKKESANSTPSEMLSSEINSDLRNSNLNNNNNNNHSAHEAMNLSRKASESPKSPMPYPSQQPSHHHAQTLLPQQPSPRAMQQFYGASMSSHHLQRSGGPQDYFSRQTPSPNEAVPRFNPYAALSNAALSNAALGLVPMERLLQMTTPEVARNPLMQFKTAVDSMSPGSEKRSSWKGGDESRSSHEDDLSQHHLQMLSSKRSSSGAGKQQQPLEPEIEGQFICEQCDKAFSKQSSLARHKYEHSGEFSSHSI